MSIPRNDNENAILEAIAACDPNRPLQPDDRRFINLDAIRGFALRQRILKLLHASEVERQFLKVAVAGGRGCGKSTELNRTGKQLRESGYAVLWASVNENLDPRNISFSDVMRLIVQLVNDRFGDQANADHGVAEAFRVVNEWFQVVTREFSEQIKTAKEVGLRSRIDGPAEANFGIFKTALGEFSAALSILRQGDTVESTRIKETIERYNNQLVDNVNLLLRAVNQGRPLVFILDNVDKYEPAVMNQAFLQHADLLRKLEAHLIFTMQSSLLYRPVDSVVEQSFGNQVLAMLPVFERNTRNPNESVVAKIREAVYLRVPKELFDAPEDELDDLIEVSGGCWRDLLRLLEDALLNADDKIRSSDLTKARNRVAQTYQRVLRTEEDLNLLARTHLTHEVLSDPAMQYLLHHLCVLSYNGEGWYDVHPLLDHYQPLQAAIQKLRQVS